MIAPNNTSALPPLDMAEPAPMAFKLSRLSVVNAPPRKSGICILAVYDVVLAGCITITGCQLLLKPDGYAFVRGCVGLTHCGHPLQVQFSSAPLRRAIAEKALQVYEAISGATYPLEPQ